MSDEIQETGQEPQDAPSQDDGQTFDANYVSKLRDEAASWRTKFRGLESQIEELKPLAEKAKKLEEAQKTEAERLADQLAELKAQQAEAAREADRARAEAKIVRLAAKAGVDPDIAALLDISKLDLDDEAAALETLKKLAAPRTTGGGASNPSGEGQGKPSDEELRERYFGGGRKRSAIFGG